MELVSLGKDMLHDVVEYAASYRLGQSALRYLDRALWTVEKCARWAVPPPLEQDERPQPELVRPLPWPFFLTLLVALRVARESVSLLNLAFGKPPLRSADVVSYIQGKRRYLRTLKYQGGRVMRARGERGVGGAQGGRGRSWLGSLRALLGLAVCSARPRASRGDRAAHGDEMLVVKRGERGGLDATPAPSETTMERLIEKIMVDLDAESDEDSSYTLTNVTSIRSDQSGYTSETEQDTTVHVSTSTPNSSISFDAMSANNFAAISSDLTSGSAIEIKEINVTVTPSETRNNSLESKGATKIDATSKNHNEDRSNGVAKKQKIANGRAVSSPQSTDRSPSENGVY